MPNLVSSLEFVVRRRRHGFTLIEIVISLFLILATITILFTTSSTYVSSRGSNLQGVATEIASCEIERLRKLAFNSLPANGTTDVDASCNQDLSKLPDPDSAARTLSDYGTPPDPDIKQITIQVNWTVSGASREIKMDTLIYKNGL